MGELAPVLGNTDNAFTNLSVKRSELVTESPAELAALFPTVLNLVLPQLSGGLPSIALPSLGGLQLDVTAVTGVPVNPGGTDVSFLAIYAKPGTHRIEARARRTGQPATIDDPTPASIEVALGAAAPVRRSPDCTSACGGGDACIAGTCTATIEAPTAATLASGTGLFVSLVVLPDGRLAAAYYDRTARALKLAVETAAGSTEFTEAELHGAAVGPGGVPYLPWDRLDPALSPPHTLAVENP
jgi:hypothetical protein